ncbi:MAG: site-specific integrase [Planctomycetaceae bacterium]|nr:site-specific integrase [Planctomycetaceae bacterium]
MSKEEVDELRSTVRQRGSTLIADAVDLIAFTGIRRSELCRLTPDDVDLDSQTLLITEKKRVHGQTTYRKLPIHPALLSLIKNRMSNDPLFTKSVHTLTSGLRKAIKGTKFQKRGFGFHVLRHSAASRLLAQGIPVTAVAAILGHATPQTTLQVYSHAFEEDVAEGINSL